MGLFFLALAKDLKMNNPRKKLLIFIIIGAFLGLSWKNVTCYLTGHLKNKNGKPLSATKYHVFVVSNKVVLGKTSTDLKGNFNLEFNTNVFDTVFRFYCHRLGKDTVLLKTITSFDSEEPEITFYLPK